MNKFKKSGKEKWIFFIDIQSMLMIQKKNTNEMLKKKLERKMMENMGLQHDDCIYGSQTGMKIYQQKEPFFFQDEAELHHDW